VVTKDVGMTNTRKRKKMYRQEGGARFFAAQKNHTWENWKMQEMRTGQPCQHSQILSQVCYKSHVDDQ
jgi:hypothetical protein